MAEFPGNRLLEGCGLAWTDGLAEATGPGDSRLRR